MEGEELLVKYHEVLKWGTHSSLLAAAVASAGPGPVLELGAGRFSTPMLIAMCALSGRSLVSADNDLAWLDALRVPGLDLHCNHICERIENWDVAVERFAEGRWAVILLDHWPQDRRGRDLATLAGSAEWIVLHDSQDPGCGFDFSSFPFVEHDDRFFPRTTIVSMTRHR